MYWRVVEKMKIQHTRFNGIPFVVLLTIFLTGCSRTSDMPDSRYKGLIDISTPSLEATPVKHGEGSSQIAISETVNFKVIAPDASEVYLIFTLVSGTDDRYLLSKITVTVLENKSMFRTQVKLPTDLFRRCVGGSRLSGWLEKTDRHHSSDIGNH
jgi:hypothetical protein